MSLLNVTVPGRRGTYFVSEPAGREPAGRNLSRRATPTSATAASAANASAILTGRLITSASFDVTANRGCPGLRNGFAFDNCLQRLFEVMLGRSTALLAEICEAIVDPPSIQHAARPLKENGLRHHAHVSPLDEEMFRIAQKTNLIL